MGWGGTVLTYTLAYVGVGAGYANPRSFPW